MARIATFLEREDAGPALCVALSGGRDSVALLGALVQLRKQQRWRHLQVRAVHVDHQLRPLSPEWARFCRALGRRWAVPVSVRRVEVSRERGRSLEAEARNARYAALAERLRVGECLLTAHHLEDQLETLLLQLMRGAGVRGLAAMPASTTFARGRLLRPCLELPREMLARFVARTGASFVEDDSNVDPRFDRNYLRAEVLPRLQARWPVAARVAARSAAHLAEAQSLLEELATVDLAWLAPQGHVRLEALARLSAARQRNALRAWLHREGLALPDAVHLERIRRELPTARLDAQPIVRWAGGEVRRFRGELHALPPSAATSKRTADRPRSLSWRWARGHALALGPGLGRWRLRADPHGAIDGTSLPAVLRVRWRAGGERIALQSGGPRHTLKEILRASGVVPWERERIPLLYAGRRLVAVGDLVVAASFRAEGVRRLGRLSLEWLDRSGAKRPGAH